MDESLGTFDEQIRKERERLARERDANATGDAGAAEGGGGTEGGEAGAAGGGGGPEAGGVESDSGDGGQAKSEGQTDGGMKSEGGNEGQGGGGAGSTGTKGQGPSTTPKNIPDGRDDDVIARQIREAAEKETDPELRDKLWKEYIEYKKNTQGR
jgi:hypothetical protein